jgi:rare lipoprotein A
LVSQSNCAKQQSRLRDCYLHDKEEDMQSVIVAAILVLLFLVDVPHAWAQSQEGVASVYSTESGSRTASGEKLNAEALTAAHRTLPFGTKVLVTNARNGHSVLVRINDRGPFVPSRVIDVTPAAARALQFSGITKVTLHVLGGGSAN